MEPAVLDRETEEKDLVAESEVGREVVVTAKLMNVASNGSFETYEPEY